MTLVTPDHYLNLGGGAFAMNRARRYAGTIEWKVHTHYSGFDILRAYHIDTGKPCALYGFILADTILIVSENLQGIKAEAKRYSDPNQVI